MKNALHSPVGAISRGQAEDPRPEGLRAAEAGTLPEALRRAAISQRGADTGIRLLDRRERAQFATWHDIELRAKRVARSLLALGLNPGERVAVIYSTSLEFFDAFFGVSLAGAVPVPLYPPVRLGRLVEYQRRTAAMLRLAGARLVLAEPRVVRLLGEAVLEAQPELGCRTLAQLAEPRLDPRRVLVPSSGVIEVDAEALAMVQFSSGTTSSGTSVGEGTDLAELPKPIALSHRALLMQAHMLGTRFPDRRDYSPSGVSWLPLYHDMGLIGCVFTALTRPADLTLLPPEVFLARPALWLRAISSYRGTVSPAPNFAYSLCLERIKDEEMEGVDLSSWRVALNGAEAVTTEVLDRFTERFSKWGFRREAFTPVYGLAEAALAVTFSPLEQPPRVESFEATALSQGRARLAENDRQSGESSVVELVSVGRPVPGFELEIRQEKREPVEEGTIGRVWVRGPSLMSGYLGRPAETAEVLHDGWLDTGDEGFVLDRDLFLTGRAKDVVLLRGRNHSPEWIERALDGVTELRTGCAVAVSHREPDADSEALWIFVERATGKTAPEDTLERAARQAILGRTGLRPDRITVLAPGTLPRTSSGKLRRRETLRRFLADELEPPDRMGALPMARALLRSRQALNRLNRSRTAGSSTPALK